MKPSNMIMGAPARLIDLSIARRVDELDGTRRRIGTDAYMAPEQCEPEARGPITPAADVWGVGVTLYNAASGQLPFEHGDPGADGAARYPQLEDAPAPLPDVVDPALRALIAACLHPDPGARPRPAELAAGLEPLVERLPRRPLMARMRVRPRR